MRKLCSLALCAPLLAQMIFAPLASAADEIKVDAGSMLRLPNSTSVVQVDRLEIGDGGTLLVPASLGVVKVNHLVLGHLARIAVAPSEQDFRLDAQNAEFGLDSWISARGAAGNFDKPASPGRNLIIHLAKVQASLLLVDARGGAGTPGFFGLDGADGNAAGCTWGAASKGYNGDTGGNGLNGANGGQVRLEIPAAFPADAIKVAVDGGNGGLPGKGGKGGNGGHGKDCLIYDASGAKAGKAGPDGQPGLPGAPGAVSVTRF